MTKPVDLPLGYHLIIDLYECGSNLLIDRAAHDDLSPDSQIANEIAAIGLTTKKFITEIFENSSWSSCFLLAESHVSVHTWPDEKYVSADIFVCNYSADNRGKADHLKEFLLNLFGSKKYSMTNVVRSAKSE